MNGNEIWELKDDQLIFVRDTFEQSMVLDSLSENSFLIINHKDVLCIDELNCFDVPFSTRDITNGSYTMEGLVLITLKSTEVYLSHIDIRSSWILIGASTSASISSQSDEVFIIMNDSFPWNNQDFNCRATNRLCDRKPDSWSDVMAYIISTPSDLKQMINDGIEYITPCTNGAQYGTIGTGNDAQVSLTVIGSIPFAFVTHTGPGYLCKARQVLTQTRFGCADHTNGVMLSKLPLHFD